MCLLEPQGKLVTKLRVKDFQKVADVLLDTQLVKLRCRGQTVQGPSKTSTSVWVSWTHRLGELAQRLEWDPQLSFTQPAGGGLSKERKNQEKALLVDLCQHCTEDFKLPPSHLLASRNFCGAAELVWPGTVHWADTVICLHVYLVLESRLHSFHAQAGSTRYNHDCVMLCLR